ncbi:hypothetical protein BJY01DRAFT_258199 [Aspergillus pseudoustus]|uniref:Cobalamin-independent methionine synthase MetE C-terminal/archaeal domain-containing protein n=1 Tax=Aspergillus pseudoustus TaxID=1810923 RepID=A0ABR4JD50_9EURO
MTSNVHTPTGVLLVGSIPLSSTDKVFTKICSALRDRLYSIPDGETGIRGNYIGWELDCFPKEAIRYFLGGIDPPPGHLGFTLESIKPSQYDTAALDSYKRFTELRAQGIIPQGIRFQVCLPSPLNCILGHTRPELYAELEPLYERRLLDALANILKGIPAQDLAIQWDLCFEIATLELDRGNIPDDPFQTRAHFTPVLEGVLDRLERICADIPVQVPVGFHICYADLDHKHFLPPKDLGLCVELANGILRRFESKQRPVQWIHVPVPKDRDDIAYFESLSRLKIGEETRLFLGLVHANDEEGTRRRIRAAQSIITRPFGVATECGMGRTPAEELDSILHISKAVTDPV